MTCEFARRYFVEATFENWESEFLQMAMYVVLTAFLVQRGSSESKPVDGDAPQDADPRDQSGRRYCQDLWMRLFQAASCWSGEAVPGSTSSPFLKVAPART